MTIINKHDAPNYSGIADRTLAPGQCSADKDFLGVMGSIRKILKSVGGSFTIRLSDEELNLIKRLEKVNEDGWAYKYVPKATKSLDEIRLEREAKEKADLTKAIVAARTREETVRSESTYTHPDDVLAARSASGRLSGEVKAKKLASTGGAQVSLSDLIGDNKFIEESMKHSGIATAMASTEGWDVEKMKEKAEEPQPVKPSKGEEPEKTQKKQTRKGRKANG